MKQGEGGVGVGGRERGRKGGGYKRSRGRWSVKWSGREGGRMGEQGESSLQPCPRGPETPQVSTRPTSLFGGTIMGPG